MADQPDFDAADLADAILGVGTAKAESSVTPSASPAPPSGTPTRTSEIVPTRHGALGWVLLLALLISVSIAISLAVQLNPTGQTDRVTPPCGGLFSECCDDWDDNWGPCPDACERDRDDGDPADRGRGLFDREDDFAPEPGRSGC